MQQYTGRERIKAAFKREYADRVPIYPITARFNARISGIKMREFLTKPDKMAQAILNYHEMFNPDICLVMGDMLYEVESPASYGIICIIIYRLSTQEEISMTIDHRNLSF